jgi:hypothetical protein
MKRVRITMDPHDIPLPPIYERMTRGADDLSRVHIVNWNVSEPPTGFLLWFYGDYEQFDEALASDGAIDEYALLPRTDEECYCFLSGEVGPASRALFENFTRGTLLTVPPIVCHDDGSSTFTLVGTDSDIQNAVEGVPPGVDVTVERVGGERVTPDSAVSELSARQREAVETAIAVGYYTVPRESTIEDVAEKLDCATATAAEHLRKAEATVFRALLAE